MVFTLLLLSFFAVATGTPVIYDGRAPFSLKNSALDVSSGPYLTCAAATDYMLLLFTHCLQWCQGNSKRHPGVWAI